MFESDDWDLDQDLLNDIDVKATQYYSQIDEGNESKRRKIEIDKNSIPDSWESKVNTNEKTQMISQSRNNLIFGIFHKNVSQDKLRDKRSVDNISLNKNRVQDCDNRSARNSLVLDIPKNNIIEDKKTENSMYNYKNSRKQLLCDILKQQSVNTIELKKVNPKTNLSKIKSPQKMTLIRKFPGPAGLLPDDIDIKNLNSVSYLNSLNESETHEEDSSELVEYCSQETKNLFTEGAWQSMLNDLPQDFLKGHDIATIKRTATVNGYDSIKAKFLAGIIEHIDDSNDNPSIVLKDFTDSIQGIVHRDIPLKYPGLLKSNVVILLRDVGLLRISGTFSNNYRILIPLSSLIAIYTDEGTIERTQYMESTAKTVQSRINDSVSGMPLEAHSSLSYNQPAAKSPQNLKQSEDYDKKIAKNLLKHLKRVTPDRNEKVHSSKISKVNAEHSINIKEAKSEKMDIEQCNKTVPSPCKKPKNISVRSELLRFKHTDALTPLESSTPSESSSSLQGVLKDNDSDDEILSQMDMDIIFSNYNNKS